MGAWVHTAVLLGLVLVCDGLASFEGPPPPRPENSSDFYVLVQQWLPEVCSRTGSTSRACASPRPPWKNHLVLHTLQLHGPNHSVYEECDDTPLDIKDLPSALSAQGPEVIDGVSWAEAWRRYGTCVERTPRGYFEEALQLHQATKTPDLLRFAVGQAVNASDLLAAYGVGQRAVLECHEGSNLSAVYTCWSRSGADDSPRGRAPCPPELGASHSCGPEVHIASFVRQSPGQSQFATAIWLVQYVFLLSWFVWGWRADHRAQRSRPKKRGRRCGCACTRRTPIQLLAIVHAGTGVFSELWAIHSDAAGETGLPMWPLMSVLELASNLLISVLMIRWYTTVCSSLGLSMRWRAYCAPFSTVVVVVWSGLYLMVNVQRSSARDMKQREMDPIPWVSFLYYIINMVLEGLCLAAVDVLRGALFHKEDMRPTLQRVYYINLTSMLDSIAMVLVHVQQVQEFMSMYFLGWHPWTMLVLFFIRYVTVSLLIEPVSECETSDAETSNALHFGPLPSYEFQRGLAFVCCNGGYTNGSGQDALDNRVDARRWKAAFEFIGFEVTLLFDLAADDIMSRFEEWVAVVKAAWAEGLALAFAYSGHGDQDVLIGVDGATVRILELMSKCVGGEAVVPKLFFFDACRGASSEERRPYRSQLRLIIELFGCSGGGPSAMEHRLACYATARTFRAYGHEGEFTKIVCQHIEDLAEDGCHDIEDALKLAGAQVAVKQIGLCFRQCPTYESTLTRRFKLQKVEGVGRSSSSLTGTTALGSDLVPSAGMAGTSSTSLPSAPVM